MSGVTVTYEDLVEVERLLLDATEKLAVIREIAADFSSDITAFQKVHRIIRVIDRGVGR